jgi:hypothetical protein
MNFSVQSYVIAGLVACLLLVGWLYRSVNEDLQETKASLAVAEQVNAANKEAVERMERRMESTDRIVAGWNTDRTILAGVRNTVRQGIREAMQNEVFKVWGVGIAPADAWRMLATDIDASGSGSDGSAVRTDAGLSGNTNTDKRD